MKKIMMTLLMSAALAMTLVSTDALAKRMANGGNMGMQRSATPAPSAPPTANKNTTAPTNATSASNAGTSAASKSSWMGPLMGFAAGGLLAAMFMGGGFDGIGGMDIILLLLIAVAAFMFFRRRTANQQTAAAGPQRHYDARQSYDTTTQSSAPVSIGSLVKDSAPTTSVANQSIAAPSWFNAETFLPQAKTWYVKLQAAWDNNDRDLLAALTTPELFAQLAAQLDVATEENHTQVEEIHAEIVEFSQENGQTVLMLRYTGYVAETVGAFSHAIHEYWHLIRIGGETGEWKLAGIQQAQS